jgi:asparagine synthase (glutamine-hydrolysing)
MLRSITRSAGITTEKAVRGSLPAASFIAKRQCGLLAAVDNVWSPAYAGPSKSAILTDEYTLRAATGTMIHRGPDGRHTARGSLKTKDASWVMGHQRLAIVDPNSHAADMPFLLTFGNGTPQERKIKLAANGEIYNHKFLYADLVANHGWTQDRISASDCEVIAHACACLGPEEAVTRLDGMFAFCLFEEASDTGRPAAAFAARDPVGIKPLYYGTTEDGAYVFASELKALVGQVVPSSVTALPPGHYWTPQTGLVRYHRPEWNFNVRA